MYDPSHPVFPLLCESLEKVTGREQEVTAAPFPCDAFVFEKFSGTPTVIFGPFGGNLHSPDEWIDIESLVLFTETMLDFIPKWCGSAN
jgi:acetylornithine deacetylase